MQYGVCGGPEIACYAAEAGFDYFEWTVGALLRPLEDRASFETALAQVRAAPLPCPAVNVLLPGDFKVTGPNADLKRLTAYISTAFQRAEQAGVNVVVFGSGGARRIPDGFDRLAAWGQIVSFCQMMALQAAQHGVTVVIEPLNQGECNVLNSVGEAMTLARQVNRPSLRVLVDAYHWAKDGDTAAAVIDAGKWLAHAHIATVANRLAPGAEVFDFGEFFGALRQIGYDQRLSIEGRLNDPANELRRALMVMKSG